MKKQLYIIVFVLAGALILNSCDETNPATTYQVSFSVQPAKAGTISPASGKYEAGTKLNISASPSKSWRFDHWEGDYSGTNSTATITIQQDMHIIGVFKKKIMI